jgi:Acetyltransferases, including N-acetylases of ribosomal proteins
MLQNILLNFSTETFEYKMYSNSSLEKEMLNDFEKDEAIQSYLCDFKEYISETENDIRNGIQPLRFTNIIYYQGVPIGLVTLYVLEDEAIISQGISPEFRGNRFSSSMKKELCNYVFSNTNIEKIIGYVESTNERSINSSKKIGLIGPETVVDSANNKTYFKYTYNRQDILGEMPKAI